MGGGVGGGEVAEVFLFFGISGAESDACVQVSCGFVGGIDRGLRLHGGIGIVLLLLWVLLRISVRLLRSELLLRGELAILVDLWLGSIWILLLSVLIVVELARVELLLGRVCLGILRKSDLWVHLLLRIQWILLWV